MNDKLIIKAVNDHPTMVKAAESLEMNYNTFKRKAIKLGVWNPNQGSKGLEKKVRKDISTKNSYLLSDILSGKFPLYQSRKLKIRLIDEKIFKDECSECGWSQKRPNEKYSTCELHHKNGNPQDHRLENLTILCPNCHSLTPNFRNLKR